MSKKRDPDIYPTIFSDGYTYSIIENLSYIPHLHKGIEGILISHGSVQAAVEGKSYTLQEGDICLVMPFCRHSFETPQYSEVIGFGVISEDVLLQSPYLFGKYRLKNPVFRKDQYPKAVTELFDLLMASPKNNLLIHIGLLHSIVGYLFDVTSPKLVDKTELTQEERVLLYLHENLNTTVSLMEAAEALNMSQFKLSRICNQEIGIGFNAYLKSLRISAAKRRLAYTNSSISDIAACCGFESLRTFNRAFSEETGITPREFRRNHINKLSMDCRTTSQTKKNFTHIMT